jgi:hypothetical protein
MSVLLCVASLAEILSAMAFFTLHKVYHLSHAPRDYRLQGVETILTEKMREAEHLRNPLPQHVQ